MTTDSYCFPAVFTYEEGAEIAVIFPDLDVATSGENDTDAMRNAEELLGITLLGKEQDGEPIPVPSQLSEIQTDARERTVLVTVFMPAIRLANEYRSVNRTVTLPAWLNARALAAGVNFSQTLQDALRTQLHLS